MNWKKSTPEACCKMTSDNISNSPKYACKECGSDEVRSEYDSYQVFRAEDDKLVHLRSEFPVTGLLALYCNWCGEQIQGNMAEATIE